MERPFDPPPTPLDVRGLKIIFLSAVKYTQHEFRTCKDRKSHEIFKSHFYIKQKLHS